MKIELILWEDSFTVDKWTEFGNLPAEVIGGEPIVTIGMHVYEDKEFVAIANSCCPVECAAIMFIPTTQIRHRITILSHAKLKDILKPYLALPDRPLQCDSRLKARRRTRGIRTPFHSIS